MEKDKKIVAIAGVVILFMATGYIILTSSSNSPNEEQDGQVVNLQGDELQFESSDVLLETRKLAVEVTEFRGTVDGQLLMADATNFVDLDSGSVKSYTWETAGETYNGTIMKHFYEDAGEHELKLTVVDQSGVEHTDTISITTEGIIVEVERQTLSDDETKDTESLLSHGNNNDVRYKYQFTAPEIEIDGNEVEYEWNLGDGNVQSGETASRTFRPETIEYIDLRIYLEDLDNPIIKETAIHSGHDYHSGYEGNLENPADTGDT